MQSALGVLREPRGSRRSNRREDHHGEVAFNSPCPIMRWDFCRHAWPHLILPAAAQEPLTAPVTMTVGFGAGERPDLYGRILGRSLVRFLPGTPGLLVLNKPGAGGVIASQRVGHQSRAQRLARDGRWIIPGRQGCARPHQGDLQPGHIQVSGRAGCTQPGALSSARTPSSASTTSRRSRSPSAWSALRSAPATIRRFGARPSWAGTFNGCKAIGSPASFGRRSSAARSTWHRSA